ncbi:aminotransferase class I and II [Micromonospora sp. WMMD1120]|uniref:HipA family kinase n=1 Tax=Micromonospora sp. WMMD1120 TaxID=3016106 RepID=UPI002416830E|nr:HipA family kinase [Micromonospora sp. WMMD1120]MDG4811208.1 aminotransferase class I and II [Micromonospora sp. WMMD1120]
MLRQVTAIRYVTPLREGGSLPGVVEADDLGTYVAKFRGAGQGPKALIAEVICGELARRLDLRVPPLVVLDIDPVIGRAEPDQEVQELLRNSGGANLGMDFLPGALGFDPVAHPVDPVLASRVFWFDAYVENVDRSWRNPNLLIWHRELWLIDHGAALYFHHNWPRAEAVVHRAYRGDDHVLAPYASRLAEADAELAARVTPELLAEVLAVVPDAWLTAADFATAEEARDAYLRHLSGRVARTADWLPSGRAA